MLEFLPENTAKPTMALHLRPRIGLKVVGIPTLTIRTKSGTPKAIRTATATAATAKTVTIQMTTTKSTHWKSTRSWQG